MFAWASMTVQLRASAWASVESALRQSPSSNSSHARVARRKSPQTLRSRSSQNCSAGSTY